MKRYVASLVGALLLVALAIPALADEKSPGEFLLDAALGAGEGAIVGQASGGKAGKGALIGAGTALGREAIIKPILKGGMSGGPAQPETVTRRRQVVEEEAPLDPFTEGYQKGFKDGYNEGYKAGLSAASGGQR